MEARAGVGHGGSVSCILDCILKQWVMVRPQKETPYETEELGWRGEGESNRASKRYGCTGIWEEMFIKGPKGKASEFKCYKMGQGLW